MFENGIKSIVCLSCLYLLFSPFTNVFGRVATEVEQKIAEDLGKDIAAWIDSREWKQKSIAVFSIHVSEPLESDYGSLIENYLLKELIRREFLHASSCYECRTPQVNVEGELLVIRKGVADLTAIKTLKDKFPVEAFVSVDVFRNKLSITAQASLIRNGSAELIDHTSFRYSAFNGDERSVLFLLGLGLGKALDSSSSTSNNSSSSSDSFSFLGSIFIGEEIGFGKGGLGFDFISTNSSGLYLQMSPTVVFLNRFGNSGVMWAIALGGGLGLLQDVRGFATKTSLEIFLGSWAFLGFNFNYFLNPTSSTTTTITSSSNNQSFKGFWGAHFGISIGR